MKYSIIFLILLVLIVISGCETYTYEAPPSKSFVYGFRIPDGIVVTEKDSKGIGFRFDGETIHAGDEFDSLCDKYGDISYNAPRPGHVGPCVCIDTDYISMKVEAVDDFDAMHPAGSDVSDLIDCAYTTVYEFVHNGYECFDRETRPEDNYGFNFTDIYKLKVQPLSSVSSDNTKLLYANDLLLVFKSFPDSPGEHKFRLTITINGVILEKHLTYNF